MPTTTQKLKEFAELTGIKLKRDSLSKISNFIDNLEDGETELLKVFLVNQKKYFEIKKGDKTNG